MAVAQGSFLEVALLSRLRKILPDKYQNIRPAEEQGGMRSCFDTEWGLGEEPRIIKVDRIPTSPRGIVYLEKGYTTRHDIGVLSRIKDPERHHLVRLCDYYEVDGMAISVETRFDGSVSLEKRVGAGLKPLSLNEFERVFSMALDAENYLINSCGFYHRDLKPSNILVRGEGDNIEVRVTDFGNAGRKNELPKKMMPSAGSHYVTDPIIEGVFTGHERSYDESNECYAIAMDMFFSLTARYPVEYDPDNGLGASIHTLESVLTDGKLDVEKHNLAITQGINALPPSAKKRYGKMLADRLMITQLEDGSYSHPADGTVKSFMKEFEHKKNRGFFKKLKKYSLPIISSLVIGSAVALGVSSYSGAHIKELQSANRTLEEKSQEYGISTRWNRDDLTITNNLLELGVSVSTTKDGNGTKLYSGDDDHFDASPGQKLNINILCRELPRPNKTPGTLGSFFKGKAYFEGFEGQEFTVLPSNGIDMREMDGYNSKYGGDFFQVTVPLDMNEGVYIFAVELYPPKGEDKGLVYNSGDEIIFRKRIPVAVGSPKQRFALQSISFPTLGYLGNIGLKTLGTIYAPKEDDYDIDATIFEKTASDAGFAFNVLSRKSTKTKAQEQFFSMRNLIPENPCFSPCILHLVYRAKDGSLISEDYLPIKGKRSFPDDKYPAWALYSPGKGLSTDIQAIRQYSERSHDNP